MKSVIRSMSLVLCMICIIAFASPMLVSATSLDDLSNGSNNNSSNSQNYGSNDGAISDYLHGYNPVTKDNMAEASTVASPIVNMLGTVSGFIIMVVSAGIFCVTALDLAYIGLPFTRSFLNPRYASGGSQGGRGSMGAMSMGGSMGAMGGSMGGSPQAQESGLRRQWISDEAEYCVNFANQQDQATQGGMPGGGMPMGGSMGMNMGGGGGQQSQQQGTKSIILMYLKKRMFFLIIFAVASVVLMSSALTDCGLNIAELITKVTNAFSDAVGNVNI